MKYLGIISYNGSRFYGFQRQPHLRSVQGVLEKALSRYFGTKIEIKGAGRTDRGVHALGQAISFESENIGDVPRFIHAINRLLPSDVCLKSLRSVDPSFDARHSCCGKVYVYRFSWGPRDPLQKDLVAQVERSSFDPDLFSQALMAFKGTHDFSNFTTKSEDIDHFVRTIKTIEPVLDRDQQKGQVTFVGTGFMTYMVRLIMGACFKVALGKIKLEDLPGLIDQKPRHIVSFKAPAEGLYLVEVLYA